MLNASLFNTTSATTYRSTSLDLSDQVASPRSRRPKNILKASTASSLLENVLLTMNSPQDLQLKINALTAEIEQLNGTNGLLLTEVGTLRQQCKEAQRLIGRNATISITKGVIDNEYQTRCQDLEEKVIKLTELLEKTQGESKSKNQEISEIKGDETFEMPQDFHQVEFWKEKYHKMEKDFSQEIEILKNQLQAHSKENDLKGSPREHITKEIILKRRYDYEGTPKFAKETLVSLSSPEENSALAKKYEEILAENRTLEAQLRYYKKVAESQKLEIEAFRKELVSLQDKAIPEDSANLSNPDEMNEMPDPIQIRALIADDDASEKCEKRFDLALIEAIEGDQAVSIHETSEEELLSSEPIRKMNITFEISESLLEITNMKPNSSENRDRFYEDKKGETERLKEEIGKLKRNITEYERNLAELQKKVQEAEKEKEVTRKKVVEYNVKFLNAEKQLTQLNNLLEINKKQNETMTQGWAEEKGLLFKKISDYEHKLNLLTQNQNNNEKSEHLENEVKRLTEIIEEDKIMLNAYETENERLQKMADDIAIEKAQEIEKLNNQITQLEKVIERSKAEIEVWKNEFTKLDDKFDEVKKQNKKSIESSSSHKRTDTEGSLPDSVRRLDLSEKKVMSLMRENNELNGFIKAKLKDIEGKDSSAISLKCFREEMSQKWLKSCTQMEEIAMVLESKKDNMQAQLDRMKAIIESFTIEIEELHDRNDEKTLENETLEEEVKNQQQRNSQLEKELKLRSDEYEKCLHELEELKKAREFYKSQITGNQ